MNDKDDHIPPAPGLTWEAVLYGTPIAKKRPRFARRENFVSTYNDQQTEEGRLYLDLKQAWGEREPLSGPLAVELAFGMPIPTATSHKKRMAMIRGEIRHEKKPDIDNLAKFICDVGNGILWRDDSQIDHMVLRRCYSELPFTRIVVVA